MNDNGVSFQLFGTMAEKYGREHRLFVGSPAEAIRLMSVNYKGFAADLANEPDMFLMVDGMARGSAAIGGGVSDVIALVPVEMGAKEGWQTALAIAGIALLMATGVGLAAGGTGWGTLFGTGLKGGMLAFHGGLVSFGVGYAISAAVSYATRNDGPSMDPSDPETQKLGSVFGGPINATSPGLPVAIGYGRLRVGSFVISASISPTDRPDLLQQGL